MTTQVAGTDRRVVPWVTLLWNNRLQLCKSAAIGLILALAITVALPVRYRSTVQIMPPERQSALQLLAAATMTGQRGSGLSAATSGAATPTTDASSSRSNIPSETAMLGEDSVNISSALSGNNILGIKTPGALLTDVLEGQTVEDDLIRRFNLLKVYSCDTYEDARIALRNYVKVDENLKTGIVSVTVSDRDRVRARDLAAAHVDELNALLASMNATAAHRERMFLEQRLNELNQDIEQSSKELSRFSSRHKTLDMTDEARTVVRALADLQGELMAAESELQGVQAIYSDNNMRVQSLKARIDELRRSIQSRAGKDGVRTSQEDLAALSFPPLHQLPGIRVSYADLYRRVQIEEAMYVHLTKQYEMARVEEARELPVVKVLDSGNLAERRSFPPRTSICLTGIFLGVAFTCVYLVFKREWSLVRSSNPWKQLVGEVFANHRFHRLHSFR